MFIRVSNEITTIMKNEPEKIVLSVCFFPQGPNQNIKVAHAAPWLVDAPAAE